MKHSRRMRQQGAAGSSRVAGLWRPVALTVTTTYVTAFAVIYCAEKYMERQGAVRPGAPKREELDNVFEFVGGYDALGASSRDAVARRALLTKAG